MSERPVTERKIPALIVSGFLGSGKTTLVRRLLDAARREGARVAFVSNELGELGVDQALLGGGQESFVELAGGCVCCALNDALYDTLIALRERIDPDRIVVETSGAAVPHDVQITFYQPPIRDWISEEAVVVVVSADQVDEGRDLDGTFAEQIESADIVLLNKVDLVPEADLGQLSRVVEALNPGVPVLPCARGDVDPRLLLAESVSPRGPHNHEPEPPHEHSHESFATEEIAVPAGERLESLDERLRALGALRIKGFVALEEGVHVVQGVGRRLEILPWEEDVDSALLGRVVVIRRVKEPASE